MKGILKTKIEFRSAQEESDSIGTLYGKAISFDTPSTSLPWVEQVESRAVPEELLNEDIVATFNHDKNQVLGRTSNGTLRLEKRSDGVYYEVDLPDTDYARNVAVLAARGDIGGSSYEFNVASGKDSQTVEKRGAQFHRTIHKMGRITAVNPVVRPAYDSSFVAAELRSMEDHESELEKMKQEELEKEEQRKSLEASTLEARQKLLKFKSNL